VEPADRNPGRADRSRRPRLAERRGGTLRPLWTIGFRPFYLGAAVFAAIAVPAWYAGYRAWLPLGMPLPGMAWHAHEMIFGFAPAVIGGFLLTAVRTWTGRPTPSGSGLAALFALWAAGRLLMVTGPSGIAAVADVAFPATLAVVLAIPLWRSGNRRNAFVVPLLLMIAALSAAHHGSHAGWLDPTWASRSITTALDLIALLLAVIGGRVIPAFSANAVPGLVPRRWTTLEIAAVGSLVAIALVDVSGAPVPRALWAGVLGTAALAHALRLLGWQPWATRGNGLLLALPLAYLWLPVYLSLRALLDPGPGLMSVPALHALSVGAMAAMMLAMMTRSALGHTGRPLTAGRAEILAFAAVHLAAVARVFGPLVRPEAHVTWMGISATLWTVAFAAFAIRYAGIVVGPRLAAEVAPAPSPGAATRSADLDSARPPP
jgi:uncharacterized protein involved in response to NO